MADDITSHLCMGGPLDGRHIPTRSSDGFLAVDRQAGLAWVYHRDGDLYWVCTDHDDALIYPEGASTGVRRLDDERVWKAGEQSALDIIAVES